MEDLFAVLIPLGVPLIFLGLGLFVGRFTEKRHYRSIHAREDGFLATPAISTRTLPEGKAVADARLVQGAVVVSVDHFKRFLAGFRKLFGGEIRSYSPLIDRGRREAMLRMKESCPDADLFLNCRLETSTVSNGKSKATGTVEIVAYSTAIKFVPAGS